MRYLTFVERLFKNHTSKSFYSFNPLYLLNLTMASTLNPIHQTPNAKISLREAFNNAQPFRFLVIDNFLHQTAAEKLSKNFPEKRKLSIHWKGLNEKKSEGSDWNSFGHDFLDLHKEISSPAFYQWLSEITGIDDLFTSNDSMGSGLHLGENNSFLDIHVDFSMNTKLNVYRRINMLIYLNEGWQEDWGGNLELWDGKLSKCHHKISPISNRCVLFETSDESYHGYDLITVPNDDIKRKSIYAYFYTKEHEKKVHYFDTTFRARPEDKMGKKVKTTVKELTKNFVKQNLHRLGVNVYKL